jgi:predicted GIY-YIG superfamily endonuclease
MRRSPGKYIAPPPPARTGATIHALWQEFAAALAVRDGVAGAQAIHELWMRGEMGVNVERALEQLWAAAAPTVPDWLPMRHVQWLPLAYEVTARFIPRRRGRSNIYLVLLDYSDSRAEPYGVYVGMTRHTPEQRFEQHKAGIRAAGSVLQRGLEVLAGPTLHLQGMSRTEAVRIEEELALALQARGLFVQGGH